MASPQRENWGLCHSRRLLLYARVDAMVNKAQDDIRAAVLELYHAASRDPITAPAAFGVACSLIQIQLGCHLSVAAYLLNDWLKVPAGTVTRVTGDGVDGSVSGV